MDKNFLYSIGTDKLLHFIAGLLIAQFASVIASIWLEPLIAPVIGLIASLLAGAAKELWDSTSGGVASVKDFLATIIGGLIGSIIVLIEMLVLVWQRL